MIYGETGQYPLWVQAKSRMLSYWYKLVDSENADKMSNTLYKFLFKLYEYNVYKAPHLQCIETTLNEIGMPGEWLTQGNSGLTHATFKVKTSRALKDAFIQSFYSELDNNEFYYNYRISKKVFGAEPYLKLLPSGLLHQLIKFKTLNHKLPIQSGRINNIPRRERLCTKCELGDIGDEFHYILVCPYFNGTRRQYIKKYYFVRPNCIKYEQLFCSTSIKVLRKLVYFIKEILKEFC